MLVHIPNILQSTTLNKIRDLAQIATFASGSLTAGWHAKEVKNNEQVIACPELEKIRSLVVSALEENAILRSMTFPKRFVPPLLSRCQVGQGYGLHIDDALMGGTMNIRSDISVTVFLSNPEDYEGGELIIETLSGADEAKPPAGDAIIYPSTTLHRVAPVTKGIRLAAVTWIESRIRDTAKREILFDLDRARRQIFQKEGKCESFDLIAKSYSNLLRSWSDSC
ncbi:MAG: Fe2+-dependent dioxygenase [Hyphomicrobium sp.]